MDNRQNRFPGPDEGFPEDMDEMEDLNPALPDADEILDGLGEDFRFDPDDTLSEEQEAPYDEPDEPLPVPADEERTIAFDAGHAEGTGETRRPDPDGGDRQRNAAAPAAGGFSARRRGRDGDAETEPRFLPAGA